MHDPTVYAPFGLAVVLGGDFRLFQYQHLTATHRLHLW